MQKSSMREVSQIKGTNQQEAKGAIVDTKKANFIESIIIGMNKGKLMNKNKEELVAMFLAQQASHLKPVISGKLSTLFFFIRIYFIRISRLKFAKF